jgi:hypothetical protein
MIQPERPRSFRRSKSHDGGDGREASVCETFIEADPHDQNEGEEGIGRGSGIIQQADSLAVTRRSRSEGYKGEGGQEIGQDRNKASERVSRVVHTYMHQD